MSPPTLPDLIAALKRLSELPVLGPITLETLEALDISAFVSAVFGALVEKAAQTSNDEQLHSFSFMAPVLNSSTIIITGMTWPKPLPQVRDEAKDQFLKVAANFAAAGIDGALQFDLFPSENGPPELRMAWLPLGEESLKFPEPLRRSLLPWGTGFPEQKITTPFAPVTQEIVELAKTAWKLSVTMEERFLAWPDEDKPRQFNIGEARERLVEAVKAFNAAAGKVGLSHTMPLSEFDDTWRPHNLENALALKSLPATIKADLLRVLGPDARDRFTEAWTLFERAHPRSPDQKLLDQVTNAAITISPQQSAALLSEPVDVFISYAWSDKTRGARDIYELVRQSGLSAWIDEEQRLDNSYLNDQIAAAMIRSKHIIICVSLEMLTRGGYAMREVLLALSSVPERCLIVRLDRIPLPEVLAGLRSINWFERDGAPKLSALLKQPIAADAQREVQMLKMEGPIVDKLIAPLKRPRAERRNFNAPNRRAELPLRANLISTLSEAIEQQADSDWTGITAVVGPDLLKWSALNATAVHEDPTVLGAALRLRFVLFRARVQLGNHDDWEVHNKAAVDLLSEILDLDLQLLRPAPQFGWLAEDCRLAHQDCLDLFYFAKEWFRGWSPEILIELCGVAPARVFKVEERVSSIIALLGERMFALRAWQECEIEPEPAPSWPTVWSNIRTDLTEKLRAGAHPVTAAYFEELNRLISPAMIDELSTAITDSVVESRFTDNHREELFFDLPDFRLRCVIHTRVSPESKHASLASVRGTVLNELRGSNSENADLSILFTIFTQRDTTTGDWNYGLFLNCAPSENAERVKRLPSILLNPFFMAEMLNDDELNAFQTSTVIYEEF